jgi:hypothetical protein
VLIASVMAGSFGYFYFRLTHKENSLRLERAQN